jgi:pilus assembly protein CpaE
MDSVIKATDVPELVAAEHPYYVPNDFALVAQSLNVGVPFVLNHGKTDIAKSMFRMAEQLISRREISLFQPKQPSFLQALFHRPKGNATHSKEG